jgi:branched-chain amino acid transport system ATP-binding protein
VNAVLELRDVEIRYGSVPAVRGLSVEVGDGEIVGLIGPNGAGKSTTLHAIMGLVPAFAGQILLAGTPSGRRPPEAIARSGIALVPEGRRIYANMSVEENLRLGLAGRRSRDAGERKRDFEWVHDLFPIVQQFAHRNAGTLSGGQQQQLAIARALVARPDVLLLDEPSLGLAPQMVDILFEALASIRERGVTVLLVEQRAQRTVAFADRTYVLANGELVTTLGPQDVHDTERMIAAYLGKEARGQA